ncbi:PREDICTED: FAD-dependent oxidoreductase domain-containing protein 2-like [Acropora digitifera]|uniref:FAD-dependent oxidoreductase domain-containing protein 2-like n=1 Tax=Acropora digitifera TaxID=70779 RepID=UPI00077A7FAF|nr:PREDICTED: FAD-dependent oxidoreductase domain-containing protein 2-like [Acropora digitifera]
MSVRATKLLVVSIVFICLNLSIAKNSIYHDYCLVGAGPGGLQLGFFLERAGRDYVIFERDSLAGKDEKIPEFSKTLGKTNKEFNMRHDWNSLLSDDESLLMTRYSKQFFPDADILVKYLNDYANKLNLKVQYNTNIKLVSRDGEGSEALFHLKDQNETTYMCKNVVMCPRVTTVALRLSCKIHLIDTFSKFSCAITLISLYLPDSVTSSFSFFSAGNSAFETADSIMGATNLIHMFARSRVRLSWETHYVGDLRAVNNGILDTYQLKSLDALLEAPLEEIAVVKKDGKLYVDALDGSGENIVTTDQPISESGNAPDNFAVREPYDRIIRCLGFKFDFTVFDNTTKPKPCKGMRSKKYPSIKPDYESTTVPGLYFAGTNTHSIDFRKSAGGFIHGFRYTARALHQILEWRNHKVTWPYITVPLTELVNVIIKRINEASGIYQMFGVLGEVIILRENGNVEYFEEFPIRLVHRFAEYTGRPAGPMIVLNMEYGKGFSGAGKDTFHSERATGEPSDAHNSNFLHPVLYFYKEPPTALPLETKEIVLPRPHRLHHIVEDFLTLWTAPSSHILPLRRFIETVADGDLRSFFASSCFKIMMTHRTAPISCRNHYTQGAMLPVPKILRDKLASSGNWNLES